MTATFKITAFALIYFVAVPVAFAETEFVEVAKLIAPDAGTFDNLGQAVSVSGDRIVVGADDWSLGRGSVYVFERNSGGSNQWGFAQQMTAPFPVSGEHFGLDVALWEDRLAVAARIMNDVDHMYIFERSSEGIWENTTTLDDGSWGDVELDEDTLIGGAGADERIYVYERESADSWPFVAELMASDGGAKRLGDSLAIDGDTIVAGADEDNELGEDSGSAYVWERDENGLWQENSVAKFLAFDGSELDEFGTSVDVEGDLIAVGAPGFGGNLGAVYLYRRNEGGSWNFEAQLIANDAESGDLGGFAVSIAEGRVYVGAYSREQGGQNAVGVAFVFEGNNDGVWSQTAELRASASDEDPFDQFGFAVGASRATMVATADGDDEGGLNAGAAYVFQLVASPIIELAGPCPGLTGFSVSGATPSGSLGLAGSLQEGATAIPGGACSGVELGLDSARLLTQLVVDTDGSAEFARTVGAQFCGAVVQAVDMVTCGAGQVVPLSQ